MAACRASASCERRRSVRGPASHRRCPPSVRPGPRGRPPSRRTRVLEPATRGRRPRAPGTRADLGAHSTRGHPCAAELPRCRCEISIPPGERRNVCASLGSFRRSRCCRRRGAWFPAARRPGRLISVPGAFSFRRAVAPAGSICRVAFRLCTRRRSPRFIAEARARRCCAFTVSWIRGACGTSCCRHWSAAMRSSP